MVTGKRVATKVTESGSIHAQIKLIIHIVPQKSVVLIWGLIEVEDLYTQRETTVANCCLRQEIFEAFIMKTNSL